MPPFPNAFHQEKDSPSSELPSKVFIPPLVLLTPLLEFLCWVPIQWRKAALGSDLCKMKIEPSAYRAALRFK